MQIKLRRGKYERDLIPARIDANPTVRYIVNSRCF